VGRLLRAAGLAGISVALAAVSAGVAGAEVPLSVMQYGVAISGTQDITWSLAGGTDVQGTDAGCRAPIEASGHLVQTLSAAKPASLSVAAGTKTASASLNVVVAAERTGVDAVHWATVNPTGACNTAPRVDDIASPVRCIAFTYHLPVQLTATAGMLAVDNGHDWANSASGRFQGSAGGNDCPWVEAAGGIVLSEFGMEGGPPVVSGGLLPASGAVTSLTRLASGPLAVPIDASTTYTAIGTGEPWLGTMTVQTTLHLTLTLTPLGGEDNSIEPGRGIGGVHLGDSLDTVRRLYPHLAIVRRVDGGKGHPLWLIGVRGGSRAGLQAIVGTPGAGGSKPPGSATVREVETTFATPGRVSDTYHTAGGIGAASPFSAIRHALPHGKTVVWKRASDGRAWGSWYAKGPGRVVTEFDLGQVSPRGGVAPGQRGYQVRVGCPGTSRLPQYAGRPAAGPC
jgi:hypothetical protein